MRSAGIATGSEDQRGDAEAPEQVRERRDVVERVVDEREGDAVEQRGADERGLRGEPPAARHRACGRR